MGSESASWQLKGMNAKTMETGLTCYPVWRSSNEEAFREISSQRIKQTHRCLGVKKNKGERQGKRHRGRGRAEKKEGRG